MHHNHCSISIYGTSLNFSLGINKLSIHLTIHSSIYQFIYLFKMVSLHLPLGYRLQTKKMKQLCLGILYLLCYFSFTKSVEQTIKCSNGTWYAMHMKKKSH